MSPRGSVRVTLRTPVRETVTSGYAPVIWAYLARLDEIPCDIFIRNSHRVVTLYATVGAAPASLRAKLSNGVPLFIRASDLYLLRRMLTVSLDRAISDRDLTPAARSSEAYQITASIVAQTFVGGHHFDSDEESLVSDTVDLLTRVLSSDDEQLWSMVSVMQRNRTAHHRAMNTAICALALAKAHGISDFDRLRDIGRGALLLDLGMTTVPSRLGPASANRAQRDALVDRAIQLHPSAGYAIITRATGAVPSYAHILLEHHERLNGSGYPAGRRAGQISLDSQLVAITDRFTDLTTAGHEPEATMAMTAFEALQRMRFEQVGQFNDDLLKTFVRMLGGWDFVRTRAS